MKEDLRFKRTEYSLKEAIMELSKKQDIYSINVTKLCQKANINRITFYTHYEDINQYIQKLEDEYMQDFIQSIQPFKDFKEDPEAILNRILLFYKQDQSPFARHFIQISNRSIDTITKMNLNSFFAIKVIFTITGIHTIYHRNLIDHKEEIVEIIKNVFN